MPVILFTSIVILLLGAVALSRVSNALGVPYPSLLALGGALLATVPGIPEIVLEPDLALALFVAPVLLDAAYDASPRDLRDNWVPITTLVLVAVSVTTAAVATVFHALVPAVPWAAAVAAGALVAPPDAAAATAVLRQVGLPHRLLLILEGESLFNDATALLIFGVAVSIVNAGGGSVRELVPAFLASVAGSAAAGAVLAFFYTRFFTGIAYAPASIVLQFTATYAVWLFAQRLGLSPILTIVTYGIAIARRAPRRTDPLMRLQSYAVWDTVVFLSNILAFALIGFQLGPLLSRLSGPERQRDFLIAGAVLATVILVRIAWVMTYNTALRFKNRKFGANLRRSSMMPSVQGGVVIAWSGMRGIVTLAAALSLPAGFPERDLVQLVAFTVVLGTLSLQGLTLGPLVRRLSLPKDSQVEKETALARDRALTAALRTLDGDTSAQANGLRSEFETILQNNGAQDGSGRSEAERQERVRLAAARAARGAILDLRDTGEIGDDAFRQIEEALDRAEIYATRHS